MSVVDHEDTFMLIANLRGMEICKRVVISVSRI